VPLQLSNHPPVGHSKKKVENFLVRTPLKLIVIGACPSSTSSLAPVRFRIENALEHKVDRVALLLAWAVPQVAAPLRLWRRTRSKPLKTDDAISGAVIHVTKSFGHLSAREPPDDKNFIAGFVKAFELSNPGPDAFAQLFACRDRYLVSWSSCHHSLQAFHSLGKLNRLERFNVSVE